MKLRCRGNSSASPARSEAQGLFSAVISLKIVTTVVASTTYLEEGSSAGRKAERSPVLWTSAMKVTFWSDGFFFQQPSHRGLGMGSQCSSSWGRRPHYLAWQQELHAKDWSSLSCSPT